MPELPQQGAVTVHRGHRFIVLRMIPGPAAHTPSMLVSYSCHYYAISNRIKETPFLHFLLGKNVNTKKLSNFRFLFFVFLFLGLL